MGTDNTAKRVRSIGYRWLCHVVARTVLRDLARHARAAGEATFTYGMRAGDLRLLL